MMYGQMTAGSWIYIGSQGIVQGTYETFVEVGRQHYGGDLAGPLDPDRRARRHGRRAAARRDDGGRLLPRRRVPAEPHRDAAAAPAISTREANDLDEALAMIERAAAERKPRLRRRCSATPPRCSRSSFAAASGPTSSPTRPPRTIRVNGYLPKGWTLARMGGAARERSRAGVSAAAKSSMAEHVRAMLDFHRDGVPTLDYGNNIRQMAQEEGVADAFEFPGFVPAYIRPLFCRGVGPFRWAALSGDPEDICRTDAKVKELMPDDRASAQLARHGARAHPLPGPAGAHLLGRARRPAPARPRLQRDGGDGRVEGADRHRPRPPRFRLGRLAQPRDRGDARRLRRGVRLAAPQRAPQLRVAARPGCRSIMAAASAWAFRSMPAW